MGAASTQTGYGFTLSLALVDEAWAVAERRVNSGYAPDLLGADGRAGVDVLQRERGGDAVVPEVPRRGAGPPGWLLLEWSAPSDARLGDMAVWDAASPVPVDRARAALMADELAADSRTFRSSG